MSFIAVGVAGTVAIAGTVASSSIQAGAAKKAAKTQAKSADAALELQREQYAQTRQDIAPWRTAGRRGLTQMQALAQQGPPQFAPYTATGALDPSAYGFDPSAHALDTRQYDFDPNAYALDTRQYGFDPNAYAFTPPTAQDLTRDPSYQFRLKEGQRALERGAAAKGGLLGGGFGRELTRYGQDVASTEYGNVYNRARDENQLRYGRALEGNQLGYGRTVAENQLRYGRGLEANQLGYGRTVAENQLGYGRALEANQLGYGRAQAQNEAQMARGLQEYNTRYNTGMGQWQAQMAPWQTLAYGGQQATQQLGQLGGQYAHQGAELLTGQGNARAAGTLGAGQAWAQGIGQISKTAGMVAGNYGGLYG